MTHDSLNIALKEWAVVCRALEDGRQVVLLRKGGIYEAGGEFEIEHRRFVLFPTFVHQNPSMLKPEAQADVELRSSEPDRVELRCVSEITDIIQLRSRGQMLAIEDEHVWADALIEMRFSYRPENPLYLLIVRAYALPAPVSIANTMAYAGCKSWVPLKQPIEVTTARAVLDDEAFEARRRGIRARIGD